MMNAMNAAVENAWQIAPGVELDPGEQQHDWQPDEHGLWCERCGSYIDGSV